ncbi:hypothetical protein MPNT_20142 [Candidatus Methylacidithermus pantelleriae]|uniref:Uncharacterized protein n=1 Tax=Candidatus Methylacidithermus pantelleriae TaxID=2744239 RepID=A0A8J2FVZ3_9BACT|nr:hypothetical protein MPNT_20142 [Candidatus Methylacidithermus pantelleriae]
MPGLGVAWALYGRFDPAVERFSVSPKKNAYGRNQAGGAYRAAIRQASQGGV